MIVYGLKTCDTCRKAMKVLAAAGMAPVLRDVRAEPLGEAERAEFLAAFGPALLNRSSTTWRALPEAERGRTEEALLVGYPALMKRPVIRDGDGRLHLGWTPAVMAALGLPAG